LEIAENSEIIVQIDEDGTTVKLKSQEVMRGPDANGFTFDKVFPMETKQEEVFEFGVRGIIRSLVT
jgi:kinesin family member 5